MSAAFVGAPIRALLSSGDDLDPDDTREMHEIPLDGSAAAVADDAWCDDVSAALRLLPCAGADAGRGGQ